MIIKCIYYFKSASMELKQYNKQGIVSVWSNSKVHNELLACSSPNPDNENLYDLEIMSVDLADRSKDLNFVGKASYNVPFRSLAWDTFGEKDGTFSDSCRLLHSWPHFRWDGEWIFHSMESSTDVRKE